MDLELTTLLLQMQTTLRADIERARQDVLQDLAEVRTQQVIANGRTGKLERAHAVLQAKVQHLSRRGSVIGVFTTRQKAKLAGFGLLVVGGAAEGIHRAIPLLVSLLTQVVQRPAP